jgi:hypothetical protein
MSKHVFFGTDPVLAEHNRAYSERL